MRNNLQNTFIILLEMNDHIHVQIQYIACLFSLHSEFIIFPNPWSKLKVSSSYKFVLSVVFRFLQPAYLYFLFSIELK